MCCKNANTGVPKISQNTEIQSPGEHDIEWQKVYINQQIQPIPNLINGITANVHLHSYK